MGRVKKGVEGGLGGEAERKGRGAGREEKERVVGIFGGGRTPEEG